MSSRSSNVAEYQQSYSASRRTATLCLHGPPKSRPTSGPLVPAIVQSTTYVQRGVNCCDGPTYSRVANPTVDELERRLGALEDAPPSVCFGTGLAAETALFLALLRGGDHAVVGEAIYGGTVRLFRELLAPLGISCTFVDSTNPQAVRSAVTPQTKLIFVETPANPTLALTDIRKIAAIAQQAKATYIVDNTFQTPVLQRPLDLGADITVYSTTKHIDGHSAALGGAITSRDEALIERVRWVRKCTGAIQAPFNSWITLQGLKTLPLRMERQSQHALTIARWLEAHPLVERVFYPGLESSPQYALAQSQHLGGHGGVVSFEVVGGIEAGKALLTSVRTCRLVEHVGSVETLITHPASMTHADVPKAQRERVGLTDGLVRLSVGLEDPSEIIEDIEQALHAATSPDAPTASSVAPAASAKGGVACLTR